MQEIWSQLCIEHTQASSANRIESIQSLWSGYGEIFRVQLVPEELGTVVVKQVCPPQTNNHPRGWNTDLSALRKFKSYDVEAHWYKEWSSQCNDHCRVPQCLASIKKEKQSWLLLEDLDASGFSRRHSTLKPEQAKACLHWLANFHARFMGQAPNGLWSTGTYWHLDTRPDEFNSMEEGVLKDSASRLDQLLENCEFKTLVHGDAKVANFCFSKDDKQVAAVDFQYIGGGCGMKDVAYFFGSCFNESECARWIPALLDFYFEALSNALADSAVNTKELEQEWRSLFAPAWTDFHRFLLGWMPGHKKIHSYTRELTEKALKELNG